jgi:hypothetical protein
MGFSLNPQKCLDEAARDLRHMGCAIYFKQCQEVNMVARLLLLGAPNTIEEEVIRRTIDKELQQIEQHLISDNNAEYKVPQCCTSKWLKYAVVREFPVGMPWEGAEEKIKSKALITHAWHLFSTFTNQTMPVWQHCSRLLKSGQSGTSTGATRPSQWRSQTNGVHKLKKPGRFKWCKPVDLSS